jgi:CRISPR-associated protein Csb3
MSIFTPAGSVTTSLSHFALFGLAAICEAELGVVARVWWTDKLIPRPKLDAGCQRHAVAEAVHRHAAERTSPQSWLALRIDHEEKATAAFSPRIKAPSSPSAWHGLQSARNAALDQLRARHALLDLQMIGALGEPAYWLADKTPDGGASRWEMKTRNRGEEFVGNRLSPLAGYVAAREVEEVLSGLKGATVNDEAGKNQPDSRSATGFARPGPVDNALAWCALWGISQFPVTHHLDAQSATACTNVPHNRTHPTSVFLPVPTRPITLARLRTIIASRHLAVVGATQHAGPVDEIAAEASRRWLARRSIRALIRFPVHVSDNPSAPERQVLEGTLIPMDDPP